MEIDVQYGSAAVIDQRWPTGRKIIITVSDRMKLFLDLAGVLLTRLSPLFRDFDTLKDLLQAYIVYFPRTFKHLPISGTNEKVGEVEDSVGVPKMEKVIAAVIRQLAKDID